MKKDLLRKNHALPNTPIKAFIAKIQAPLFLVFLLLCINSAVNAQAIVETFEEAAWTTGTVTSGTNKVLLPTTSRIVTSTNGATSTINTAGGNWWGSLTVPVAASSSTIPITGTDGVTSSTPGPTVTGTYTWAYSYVCALPSTLTFRPHSYPHAIAMHSQNSYIMTPTVQSGISTVTFWLNATGGMSNPIIMGMRTNTSGTPFPTTVFTGGTATTATNTTSTKTRAGLPTSTTTTSTISTDVALSCDLTGVANGAFNLFNENTTYNNASVSGQVTYTIPASLASIPAQFIIISTGSFGEPVIDDIEITPGLTITLGTMPTVCTSTTTTTANIPFTATTGGLTKYTITNWSSASFSNVASTSIPAVPGNIAVTVPANIAAGTYTANLNINNTPGTATAMYPISITVATSATAQMPTLSTLPTGTSAAYSFNAGDATDDIGSNDGILENAPTLTTDRYNNPNEAYSFASSGSQYIATTNSIASPGPLTFTISAWFKTSTADAGLMLGFSNVQSTGPSNYDRNLFMLGGKVCFGIYEGEVDTVQSASSYNDNNWHLATATVSPANGTVLYVDGVVAAFNTSYNSAQQYAGYWHIGYNSSWYGVDYFNGSLDDISIYNTTELTQGQVSQLYTGTGSTSSTICSGSTLTLSQVAVTGATYAWTGAGGTFSSTTAQNPTVTNPVSGAYNVSIKGTNGCVSTGRTEVTVVPTTTFIWTAGAGTSTWSTASNWKCGAAPTLATANIVIPNVSPLPALSANTTINNLNIYNTATVTVGSHLFTINGLVSGDGSLSTTSSSGVIMGTASTGTLNFTSGTNTIDSLRILDGANISLGSALNIVSTGLLRVGTITGNGAAFAAGNNQLTLLSDASGSARVAAVPNGYGLSHTSTISGTVNVQCYIPTRRTWCLLTAPITNSGVSPATTIYSSWQNGGVYTPGIGTLLSGPSGVGLDTNTSYSAYTWGGNALVAVSNTGNNISNSNGSADNIGYFIFVRGDRNPYTVGDPSVVVKNATTLSASGGLQLGDQQFSFSAAAVKSVYMVGNPYASSVDFSMLAGDNVANTTSHLSNLNNRFYVWNSTLTGSQGIGNYVCIDDAGNTKTYTKSVGQTGSATTADLSIQSGQAFFVEATAPGTASITFKEFAKNTTNNFIYRPESEESTDASAVESFSGSLSLLNSDSSTSLTDGVVAQFRSDFSDSVDNLDALKFGGFDETLGLSRNGKRLCIERRATINKADTLYLSFAGALQRAYQLGFTSNIQNHIGLGAHLEDAYTNMNTPLNLNGTTNVNINVDGNTPSQAQDRFKVVFGVANILPAYANISAVKIANTILVQWSLSNDQSMNGYVLQKSTDGVTYTNVYTTTANHTTGTYSWTDNDPAVGANYYRVISTDVLNEQAYSSVVVANVVSLVVSGVSVFPNPIQDGQINIAMNNMPAGLYHYRIISVLGAEIQSSSFTHAGGNANINIPLNITLARGAYRLIVSNPDQSVTSIDMIY